MRGAAASAREKKFLDVTDVLNMKFKYEGHREGFEKGQNEMVLSMLKKGDIKEVARLTGLSVQKIQKIKKAG